MLKPLSESRVYVSYDVETEQGGNWYVHEGFDDLETARGWAEHLTLNEGVKARVVKDTEVVTTTHLKEVLGA